MGGFKDIDIDIDLDVTDDDSDDNSDSNPETIKPSEQTENPEYSSIEEPEFIHPSSLRNFRSEFDEEYFMRCWTCMDRMVRLPFMSGVGNIWFCENKNCRNSLHHKLTVTARTMDEAMIVDVEKAQDIISKPNLDPTELTIEDLMPD